MADLLKLPYFFALIFTALLLIAQYLAFPGILDRVFRDAVWQNGESPHSSLLKKLQESTRLKRTPRFGILDCTYPIICSYGWWRGRMGIIVSSGLIELLSDEELDCMLQREIQHLESGDFVPLMLTGALPFLTYNLSKLFLSLAMHFRFVRGVRTMASLGIFLMYVRKIFSFFIYFASRARERRSDEICRRSAGILSLYRSGLEKIRASEIHHGDIPWSTEQKTLALNFLAPIDCWDTFMESLFHIPPGSPLAAVNMEPERHNVWSEYFELFSSHPLWNSRLGGFQRGPGAAGEGISASGEHDNKDSEDYRMVTADKQNADKTDKSAADETYEDDSDKPEERIAKKPYVNYLEKEKKRNLRIELAIYLSPLFSSLAAILLIVLFHGGLMGLPFLLGGAALLAVLLSFYPLSFRSLTPLSALMARAPSALHGGPIVLKGKVYYDERQSIVPYCFFFENEVIALPMFMLSFFPLELPVTGTEADDIYEVRGWMRREPHLHIEIKSLQIKGKIIVSSALPACSYIAALGFIALGIFLLALQMKGGL
ncbi:MAG: M48 family metalloprotease [Vulcanimicrobiota bacterium]